MTDRTERRLTPAQVTALNYLNLPPGPSRIDGVGDTYPERNDDPRSWWCYGRQPPTGGAPPRGALFADLYTYMDTDCFVLVYPLGVDPTADRMPAGYYADDWADDDEDY